VISFVPPFDEKPVTFGIGQKRLTILGANSQEND